MCLCFHCIYNTAHSLQDQEQDPVLRVVNDEPANMPPKQKRRRRRGRQTLHTVSTNIESTDTDFTHITDLSDNPDMSSQRSRAPRGGARAGPHETGEETQLWNETQEKILKLGKNESRAKELGKEIFDKETSMKVQEDAGTSRKPDSRASNPANSRQSRLLKI